MCILAVLVSLLSVEKDASALYLIIGAVVPSLKLPAKENGKERIEKVLEALKRKDLMDNCLSSWDKEWDTFPDREAMRHPMKRLLIVSVFYLILSVLLSSKMAIETIPDHRVIYIIYVLASGASLLVLGWFSFCLIRGLRKISTLNKFFTVKILEIINGVNTNIVNGFDE